MFSTNTLNKGFVLPRTLACNLRVSLYFQSSWIYAWGKVEGPWLKGALYALKALQGFRDKWIAWWFAPSPGKSITSYKMQPEINWVSGQTCRASLRHVSLLDCRQMGFQVLLNAAAQVAGRRRRRWTFLHLTRIVVRIVVVGHHLFCRKMHKYL